MASFPDDVWRQILEVGVEFGLLDYVDLCSLSASSRHLDQLSNESALWATLLSRDFPSSLLYQTPSKDLYRDELEKENYECLAKWLDELRLDDSSFYNWETGRAPVRSSSNYMDLTLPHLNVNYIDPVVRDEQLFSRLPVVSDEHLFSLLMSGDNSQIPSHVDQHSTREMIRFFDFKENLRRHDGNASRIKVVPNSKSYLPLNRRAIRSLPRKI